jgi:hypothetical protein
MKISVWDTFVTKDDGSIMHFDILVPAKVTASHIIQQYCHSYLKDKIKNPQKTEVIKCNFCHIEKASAPVLDHILEKGFAIIEIENCAGHLN